MRKVLLLGSILIAIFLSACTSALESPIIDDETPNDEVDCTVTPSDPSCEIDEEPDTFVVDLVNSLTLGEKVGQMLQAERSGITLSEVTEYNIGSVLSGGGSHPFTYKSDADAWYNMVEDFQDAALSSSSKIPLLYGVDAVHGHNNVYGATIFPHNINLGMANNALLMYDIGVATAEEIKVTGIHWTFSPAVSVAKNISWGRTYESFSENISIHENLVASYIEGLQTNNVIATAKHYVADGATDGGIDQGNVSLTETEVRAEHLAPYIDAIDAGVDTIMISFSSINNQKMHASDYWINDVLKGELGFEGFTISDWKAVHQLDGDFYTQLTSAINAGVDMLMEPYDWKAAYELIIESVNNGDISEDRINDAVTRILTVKYENGLFDNPYERLSVEDYFATSEHQALALQAASESMVLLKNDGSLPLQNNEKIYITGPAADHVGYLAGGWTTYWQGNIESDIGIGTSILDSISLYLNDHTGSVVETMDEADVVIVVFTEVPYAEGAGDTASPSLFGPTAHVDNRAAYQKAIDAKAAGKDVIGIIVSGRPLLLEDTTDTFNALVAIFLPGSEGGNAVRDVLYNEHPFTGKLSFGWPENSNGDILYPFGYGLTYE
jgi:beta-glucosidase